MKLNLIDDLIDFPSYYRPLILTWLVNMADFFVKFDATVKGTDRTVRHSFTAAIPDVMTWKEAKDATMKWIRQFFDMIKSPEKQTIEPVKKDFSATFSVSIIRNNDEQNLCNLDVPVTKAPTMDSATITTKEWLSKIKTVTGYADSTTNDVVTITMLNSN